jgi:hypothetical protein
MRSEVFIFVGARGLEEQNGDSAGWDVVAAEVGDEARTIRRRYCPSRPGIPSTSRSSRIDGT